MMNRFAIERGGWAYAVAAISSVLLLQIGGFGQGAEPKVVDVRSNPTPSAIRASEASRSNSIVREFTTFALNALLLPLLDDDVPARWADPSISMDCHDARVTIDGGRPDVGAPVPRTFRVRWQMDGCTPLGEGIELSGDVDLVVEAEALGYRASVRPKGLRITTIHGTETVTDPITALLASEPPLRQ